LVNSKLLIFMKTNVYKRFDPRVMEREERIRINRGLPTMADHIQTQCTSLFIIIPPLPEGGWGYTVLPLSVLPSVQDIFHRIFLSNCWWHKSDIWSQASYRYTILWVAFLDPSDSYFLFADLVGFNTHWTYMHIFRHIFLSNYW
jgi:hypothetical protein